MSAPAPKFRRGQREEFADLWLKVRRLRQWVVIIAAVAVLGMVAGAAANIGACQSRHTIVTVGSRIIGGPEAKASLLAYFRTGRMTYAQYKRALDDMNRNLATWQSADCELPWPVRVVF